MAQPHRYLEVLRNAFNTGASLYGSAARKQKNIQNALMGIGAFANIFKNFKKSKYQDMIDTANMDNWIQLGKAKNNISKLKTEYDTYSPFFQQAKEEKLNIDNAADAEKLFGQKAYERAIANHEGFRSLGVSDNYPTIEHVKDREKDFNPQTYQTLQKLYNTELENMISKAKGIKGFDPKLMQDHVNAVGRQQIDLNLEDISILDALSNKIGKRIRKFDDGIDQYRMENLTQPIAQVKKDFDRLAGAKTLNALRENFKTMKIGIAARIPQGYYEVIQNFPELSRRRIYDSVAAFADEKIARNKNGEVLNQGPTARELEEYLKNVLNIPTNATEGARIRINRLTDDLRDIYDEHSENPDKYFQLAKKTIETAQKEMNFYNSLTEVEAKKSMRDKDNIANIKKMTTDKNTPSYMQEVAKGALSIYKSGLADNYSAAFTMALQAKNLSQSGLTQADRKMPKYLKAAKLFDDLGIEKTVKEYNNLYNNPSKLAEIQKEYKISPDEIKSWRQDIGDNRAFYNDLLDDDAEALEATQNYQTSLSSIASFVKPEDMQKFDDLLRNVNNKIELGKVVFKLKRLAIKNNIINTLGEGTGHLTFEDLFEIVGPDILDQFVLKDNKYVVEKGEIFKGKELENFIKGKLEIDTLIKTNDFENPEVGLRIGPDPSKKGEYTSYPTETLKKQLANFSNNPRKIIELLNNKNEILLEEYEIKNNVEAYKELRDPWAKKLEELPYLKKYGIVLNKNREDKDNFNTFQQMYSQKDIEMYSTLLNIRSEIKDAEKIYNAVDSNFGMLLERQGRPKAYPRLTKKVKALEEYFEFVDSGKTNEKEKEKLIDRLKDLKIWN